MDPAIGARSIAKTDIVVEVIPKIALNRVEAAAAVSVAPSTISQWMSQGKLDYSKAGNIVMIEPKVLAEFVSSLRTNRNRV